MDKQNDKKARAKLKSYVPAYDKAGLWEEISSQLPAEKEDRKGLWLWMVGGGIVLAAIAGLAIYPAYKNNEVQAVATAQQAVVHRPNSANTDLATAEIGDRECMDTGQKDDNSLNSHAPPTIT